MQVDWLLRTWMAYRKASSSSPSLLLVSERPCRQSSASTNERPAATSSRYNINNNNNKHQRAMGSLEQRRLPGITLQQGRGRLSEPDDGALRRLPARIHATPSSTAGTAGTADPQQASSCHRPPAFRLRIDCSTEYSTLLYSIHTTLIRSILLRESSLARSPSRQPVELQKLEREGRKKGGPVPHPQVPSIPGFTF